VLFYVRVRASCAGLVAVALQQRRRAPRVYDAGAGELRKELNLSGELSTAQPVSDERQAASDVRRRSVGRREGATPVAQMRRTTKLNLKSTHTRLQKAHQQRARASPRSDGGMPLVVRKSFASHDGEFRPLRAVYAHIADPRPQ
jgi:hypothetical protein